MSTTAMGQRGRFTISSHLQFREKVIRQCLAEICAIQFKGHEHDASPDHDADVNFAHQTMLFPPGPSCLRVEAMEVFPNQGSASIQSKRVASAYQSVLGWYFSAVSGSSKTLA